MAKDDPALKGQADEIEAILQDGKKKEMNFVLMKAKGGVVLKAGPTVKGFPKLRAEGKESGGMPAMCVCGRLTVSGRTMNMTAVEEEPPDPTLMRKLAGQSKKQFKALGIRPAKMVMTLPNGEVIDSDMVSEDEEEETDAPETAGAPGEPPAPGTDPKAALTQRLEGLLGQVKEALAKALPGADKLGAALKAAGGEITSGALEKAASLLDAVERGLKTGVPQPPAPSQDQPGLKEQLLSEFKEFAGDLRELIERGEKAAAGKAQQFAQMFRSELEGDLKRAGSILQALRRFVEAELLKLAPSPDRPVGDDDKPTVVETVVQKVGDVVDKVVDTVKETVGGVVETVTAPPEEKLVRAGLEALGLGVDQRNELMEKLKTDPKAVEKFKTERMQAAGVPPDRQAALLKMSNTNPEAFAAALRSLDAMQTGGPVDTSPEAMQKSLEALNLAQQDTAAKQKLAEAAAKKLGEATKTYNAAAQGVTLAQGRADAAALAIEELKKRIGDPGKLTPEQRQQFADESRRLINENETAKAELAKAIELQKTASMAWSDASGDNGKAQEALDKAKETEAAARAAQDRRDGKQALLDALAFGPLSRDGLSDADKAKFAAAYGKNAKVADGMLAMTGGAKNPAALAANVEMLAGMAADGFAAPDGQKLDLPKAQLDQMALNAARMGDVAGGDYFQKLDAYMKSGKQLDPDPNGGLDAPLADPKAEEVRRKEVAQSRTRDMANAAVQPDGTVDFGSDAAKSVSDHMLFHPGSLNVFTPQLNLKTAETQKLFSDDSTKVRAQQIITDTTVPGPSTQAKPTSPGSAKALIGKTMKKDPATVTDKDARASVLSAMMTPLSQGPVGSCFSTAPVRNIRETDPLRAMDEYAKIAGTGLFKPNGRPGVPASQRAHDGENPLLRSWEYSVATAAANGVGSNERKTATWALLRPDDATNNLCAIKGIMGVTDAEWTGYDDALSGTSVEGLQTKLLKEMAARLKYEYNATAPSSGGGGDGHSTEGRYQMLFDGTAINSEAEFKDAIKAIALQATGETEGSTKGAQIVALVTSTAFIDSVKASRKTNPSDPDYLPWQLSSGGQEAAAKKSLDGGNPQRESILGEKTGTPSRSDRTTAVLSAVIGKHGSMPGEMHMLATTGKDAGHGFNALPNDPSMDKIRDPDSAAKIKSQLVDPGVALATTPLAVEQTAKFYTDEVRRLIDLLDLPAEKSALAGLLKKAPTTAMTPAQIVAKVKAECRAVIAPLRMQAYVDAKEPGATSERKALILQAVEKRFDESFAGAIEAGLREKMMETLRPPQVTVADSNWGGAENQVYFVAAPDPLTGDLVMWKRTDPSGKMTPLGQNWEDGPWHWTKP